eukprot:7889691-Pyramimonas_sp.AAC.1
MGFLLLVDRAGGTAREQNTISPPHSDALRLSHHSHSLITQMQSVTQTHSSLRPTHHSDSPITHTHSSLGL